MTTPQLIPAAITAAINAEVGRLLRAEGKDPLLYHWALVVNTVESDRSLGEGAYCSIPDPQAAAWMLADGAKRIGGGLS